MEILIEINDLPSFEGVIKRKAKLKKFSYNPEQRTIVLDLEMKFYKAEAGAYGEEISQNQFPAKFDQLVADQFTNFILEDGTDTGMSEVDYWETAAQSPISFFGQIINIVQLSASRGRFN